MKTLGNILWLLFRGIFIALEYFVASIVLIITIVDILFGIRTMKLSGMALWPFGKEIVHKETASGCLSALMNLIWILIGGIWISLSHVIFGILFGITIIGIPFAQQYFKLAALALTPIGREIRHKK